MLFLASIYIYLRDDMPGHDEGKGCLKGCGLVQLERFSSSWINLDADYTSNIFNSVFRAS